MSEHLKEALEKIIDLVPPMSKEYDIALKALSNYKEQGEGKTDKGWVALFSNEEEWIEYLKWRSDQNTPPVETVSKPKEKMYSADISDAEIKILQSLSQEDKPTEEVVVKDAIENIFSKLKKLSPSVEEKAEKEYPINHFEDINDINEEARLAFIHGFQSALDNIEEIINETLTRYNCTTPAKNNLLNKIQSLKTK